jgi:hypothetical protein
LQSLLELKKTINKVVDSKIRICENYIKQLRSTMSDRKADLKSDFHSVRKNIENQREKMIAQVTKSADLSIR